MNLAELLEAGEVARAVVQGEALLSAGNADPTDLNNLAIAYFNTQRHGAAFELLQRAIDTAPNLDASYYNRGRMLWQLGRADEAVADARRAAAMRGACEAQAHFLVGEILIKNMATRRTGADAFASAAGLAPGWARAHYLAALHYYQGGDCVEGEKFARSALEADPKYSDALWILGQALLEQDRPDEALAVFERMHAVNPDARGLREELEKLKARKAAAKRPKAARHPRLLSDYADFDSFAERYVLTELADYEPFLTKQSKVFTAGSCFAENIANGLKAQGIDTATVGVPEEINSTYANRYLLEWILNGAGSGATAYQEFFGEERRLAFKQSLSSADVVIISLGVAPCYFDRDTGAFAFTIGSHFYSQQYVFRTTTVAENVENVKAIIACLNALNPAMKIVLTVSPVPLKGTFEMKSAVIADCVSKSTLRVTAHEVASSMPGRVIYWPSFELVKWYGDHLGAPVFGTDDESAFHVSQELVSRILRAFVRRFSVSA